MSEAGKAGEGFISRLRGVSNTKKLFAVRGAAEVVSIAAASVGSIVVSDVLLREPYKNLKTSLAEKFVLPNLEKYEKYLGEMPSIDPPEEREERMHKSDHERACEITDKLVDVFGLKMLMGIAGQFIAQEVGLRALKVQDISRTENAISVAGDKFVNLLGIIYLNRGIPETAVKWQEATTKVLMNVGLNEEQAREQASYAVNWQIPNAAGFLASVGLLGHFTRK